LIGFLRRERELIFMVLRRARKEFAMKLRIVLALTLPLIQNVAEAKEPSTKVFEHFTCSGQIANYSAGAADRSVGSGDSMCYFLSGSEIGKRILKLCPVGTTCRVGATVENDQDAGDWSPIVTHIYSVVRTK
jgi:hypothetical protein